jgi:hypothetical protein
MDLVHPFQGATGRVEGAIPGTGGQLLRLDTVDLYMGLTVRAPSRPEAGAGIVTHIDPEDPRRGVVVWEHPLFPDPDTPVVAVSLCEVLDIDPVYLKYRRKVPAHLILARPTLHRGSRDYCDLLAYLLGDGCASWKESLPFISFSASLTHGWPLARGFWRTAHPWSSGVQLYLPTVNNPGVHPFGNALG